MKRQINKPKKGAYKPVHGVLERRPLNKHEAAEQFKGFLSRLLRRNPFSIKLKLGDGA